MVVKGKKGRARRPADLSRLGFLRTGEAIKGSSRAVVDTTSQGYVAASPHCTSHLARARQSVATAASSSKRIRDLLGCFCSQKMCAFWNEFNQSGSQLSLIGIKTYKNGPAILMTPGLISSIRSR